MTGIPTLRTKSILAVLALGILAGCASLPDSSNPTLSITNAEVAEDHAVLDLRIENPSDFDLMLESIDWSMIYGPMPIAGGTWLINKDLPSKGSLTMRKQIPFDLPPLDPDAPNVELSGEMRLSDPSNAGNTAFESAGFNATGPTSTPQS